MKQISSQDFLSRLESF